MSIAKKKNSKIEGLCWGGFLLGPIWGLCHGIWSSLFCLVPLLGLIMNFVLLFKGRAWAWEKNKWKDEKHFQTVQRYWSYSGFLIIPFFIFIIILASAAPFIFKKGNTKYQAKSRTSEAKMLLASAYAAETAFYGDYGIYHGCLLEMGFSPEVKNYAVGMFYLKDQAIDPQAFDAAIRSGMPAQSCPRVISSAEGKTFFMPSKSESHPRQITLADIKKAEPLIRKRYQTELGDQSTGSNQTFVVCAIGIISKDHEHQPSVICIDEKKMYSIIQKGY